VGIQLQIPNKKIISIPIAVYTNKIFKWQLSLFWFNHKLIYNEDAKNRALTIVIKRNYERESKMDIFDWPVDAPVQLCDAYFDFFIGLDKEKYLPINIQTGLYQIIKNINDEQIIELLDCDMFHLKPAPDIEIEDDELHVCTVYENWHLFSLTKHSEVIEKYTCGKKDYYNGGFVPIIGKAKTFKKILLDWILFHKNIADNSEKFAALSWWAGMYSLQAACEINKIKMISKDFCYIPNVNELNDNHYIAHYSCDPIFNKNKILELDISKFKDNIFYNRVKQWLLNYDIRQ